MKKFISKTQEKLSKLLIREYNGALSFTRFNILLRNKDIKVNGLRIKSDLVINPDDSIIVYFDAETKKLNFDILFEDENILTVIKPKGITSENFFESLRSVYKDLFFCHRLDRNTDGIMLFAKNGEAYYEIIDGFKCRRFEKYYTASVFGKMKSASGILTDYIIKDNQSGKVCVVEKPQPGAKKAVLQYNVLETFNDYSVLSIRLLTGRTHQIRAQLAKRGNFVLGDGKYGYDEFNKRLNAEKTILSATKLILHFSSKQILSYLDGKIFLKK